MKPLLRIKKKEVKVPVPEYLDTAAYWKKMMAHILNTKGSNKNCTDNTFICQTSKCCISLRNV